MMKIIYSALALTLIGIVSFMWWHSSLYQVETSTDYFADVARLYPTAIREVRTETKVEDLVAVVNEARENDLKVSISGSRHSQGGHIYYHDAIVLDMREFDEILAIDETNKTITVESGAMWSDIQAVLQPLGLAVKVMQSSFVFTVGGSLSANAHGRDLGMTTIVESVESFRLLLADGSIVNVSRTENEELFGLVIGGYGLFGVILDVTLQVTDDEIYAKETFDLDYRDFHAYFEQEIKPDDTAVMMLMRPSVDVNADDFLETITVSTWHTTDHEDETLYALGEEANVLRDTLAFDLSRRFDWAKSLRWQLQKKLVEEGGVSYVSRNNAMRPPIAPLDFLEYRPKNRTDIIQEYYVPTRNFIPFMEAFKDIIVTEDINIISSTIRYVKANDEVAWSHTPNEDAYAIIVMSNIALDESAVRDAQTATQKIVDAALQYDGTYYLTYQLFPSTEQLYAAYPRTEEVFAAKATYDPEAVFMNMFYEQYALGINQLEKIYE